MRNLGALSRLYLSATDWGACWAVSIGEEGSNSVTQEECPVQIHESLTLGF
jgi:hypothetical protein